MTNGRTKQAPTRAFIKKSARFFLNGALVRAQDSFNAEIHLAETLLLPSQLITAEAARTPLQQVYYCVQQRLIEPERGAVWTAALADCIATGSAASHAQTLAPALALVEAGRLPDALAQLRRMIKAEADAA